MVLEARGGGHEQVDECRHHALVEVMGACPEACNIVYELLPGAMILEELEFPVEAVALGVEGKVVAALRIGVLVAVVLGVLVAGSCGGRRSMIWW